MAADPIVSYFLRFFLHVPESGFRQTVGLIEKYTKMPDVRLFAKALRGESDVCQDGRGDAPVAFCQGNAQFGKSRPGDVRIPSEKTVAGGLPQTGKTDDADDRICAGEKDRLSLPGNLYRQSPGAVSLADNAGRNVPDFPKKRKRRRCPFRCSSFWGCGRKICRYMGIGTKAVFGNRDPQRDQAGTSGKAVAKASRSSFVIRTAPGRSRGSMICVVVVRRVFSFCASAVESAYSRVVFPPAPMRVMLRLVSRCSCCMSVRAKDADMSVPFLLVKIPPEIYTYFNKKKRKKKYLLKKSIKVREISIFVISPVPALQRRERFARVKEIAGCEIPCRR